MPVAITPQGTVGRLADALMKPAMYLLSGTFYEEPQRTHFWNNQKLDPAQVNAWLIRSKTVQVDSDPTACEPTWFGLPRFHAPILGGWRKYVVLECLDADYNRTPWHIGWHVDGGVAGVSRVELRDHYVRCLIGPRPTTFFAMRSDGMTQLHLVKMSEGVIGHHGQFRDVPLL